MAQKLMFKTFLKKYCQYLTSSDNCRLSSFMVNLNNNPRAVEPVFLYSLTLPNEKYFYKNLNERLKKEYNELLLEYEKYSSLEELCTTSLNLSNGYKKVYKAYLERANVRDDNRNMKNGYRKSFEKLLVTKNVTKYKVCKDNNVNPANFNEFLKGKYSRLSLDKCDQLYLYLLNM